MWGINFHGHGSVVGTLIVIFAKYASYCGLIFMDRGIPQNPRNFMHLKNFYAYVTRMLAINNDACFQVSMVTAMVLLQVLIHGAVIIQSE